MATEILKSFGTLQTELENAKTTLKGVDENIKKLIGRDPSELAPRSVIKRGVINSNEQRTRTRFQQDTKRIFNHENDEPPNKRRQGSVFKRLSEKPIEPEYEPPIVKQIISKVIVTPKEIPSRQEALAAQNCDERFKARNRRMFGALLGTLQKFQQEETKLKPKEDKRAQVEKKIEEHEIQEKAVIKKERQELFLNRKRKQAEIKMIQLKMTRMKEYSKWEDLQKPRMHFIQTKSKPVIQYMPRQMNDVNKIALVESRNEIEKSIDVKRQEVFDELKNIEDRMKKNLEPKRINSAYAMPKHGNIGEDCDFLKYGPEESDGEGSIVNRTSELETVNDINGKTELLVTTTVQEDCDVDIDNTHLKVQNT